MFPIIFKKDQQSFNVRIYVRVALAYTMAICPITVCTILLIKMGAYRNTPNTVVY
jgi:hypothetical protein